MKLIASIIEKELDEFNRDVYLYDWIKKHGKYEDIIKISSPLLREALSEYMTLVGKNPEGKTLEQLEKEKIERQQQQQKEYLEQLSQKRKKINFLSVIAAKVFRQRAAR